MADLPNHLLKRRARAESAIFPLDKPVVFGSGRPIQVPGGFDKTYPFSPHPAYYWLTEDSRPGSFVCFDGDWRHFQAPVSDAERIWEGAEGEVSGEPISEMNSWLGKHKNSQIAILGDWIEGVVSNPEINSELDLLICHARRAKDETEIELVKKAIVATKAGHEEARRFIRPGVTEREIQTEMEAAFFRAGADSLGYGSIVCADTNAAVLHFTPTKRKTTKDGIVLIDAGAAVGGYVADVTRTYPVGDSFTKKQQDVYNIVLAALKSSVERCTVDTEWHDVHRTSASIICQGLIDLGLLKGEHSELLESGVVALFFPHGVGHAVGLGVRDAGGRLPGRNRQSKCCGMTVRVDLPLEAGYLMTIEPGIYFMPALLNSDANREKFAHSVVWEEIPNWLDFGGIRIEDNVLVTPEGPKNLTSAILK